MNLDCNYSQIRAEDVAGRTDGSAHSLGCRNMNRMEGCVQFIYLFHRFSTLVVKSMGQKIAHFLMSYPSIGFLANLLINFPAAKELSSCRRPSQIRSRTIFGLQRAIGDKFEILRSNIEVAD